MIREAGSSSIKKNEVLPDKELKGLRLRAIIFGLFALIVFKYIELASDMGIIPRAHWGYVAPLIAAVGPVLMIVLVINPIVLKVFRRNVFDARDIVIVYAFLAIGVVSDLPLSRIAGPGHLALIEPNNYGFLLEQFPSLITIHDFNALAGFYRGNVPMTLELWQLWAWPCIIWAVFFSLLFFSLAFMGVIVRRRWTEVDHLTYPVVAPLIETLKTPEPGRVYAPLWRSTPLWVGFVIGISFITLQALYEFIPGFPYFHRRMLTDVWHNIFVKRLGLGPSVHFIIAIDMYVIAIGYFISLQILFSTIVFVIFGLVIKYLDFIYAGAIYQNIDRANYILSFGGMFAIAMFYLYLMRHELKQIILKAFTGKTNIDDSQEPVKYRTAIFGFFGSVLAMMIFMRLFLKMDYLWSFLYFLFFFICIFAVARLRTEGGVGIQGGMGTSPCYTLFRPLFGVNTIGIKNLAAFGYNWPIGGNPIAGVMPTSLEAYAFGDKYKVKRSSLFWAMFIGLIAALLLTFVIRLPQIYRVGANLLRYEDVHLWQRFGWTDVIPHALQGEPTGSLYPGLLFLLSAVLVFALSIGNSTFIGWPLHPLGFIIALPDYNWMFFGNFAIAFVIKAIVMRYGGASVYKRLIPLFVGVFVGDVVGRLVTSTIGVALSFI